MSSKSNKSSSESKEPVVVYKWDGTAVKNALDDAVKVVMTGKLPYKEDFGLMDGRLVICGLAVAIAMGALLWDFLNPFPLSRSASAPATTLASIHAPTLAPTPSPGQY